MLIVSGLMKLPQTECGTAVGGLVFKHLTGLFC